MAEQSFLTKLGLRFGAIGSSVALGLAAPIANATYSTTANTAANRTGAYFDQTAAAEKIAFVVGGQTGPIYTRVSSTVSSLYNGAFGLPSGTSPTINGASLNERSLTWFTASSARWRQYANANAESGANAGSGPSWRAYDDTGTPIDTPMAIGRASTGSFQFVRPLVLSGVSLTASSNAATNRIVASFTSNSVTRWQQYANTAAESGSDAGTNYVLNAYGDAGSSIDFPIICARAALGIMTIARPILHAVGTLTGSQTLYSASATWSNVATTFKAWIANPSLSACASGSALLDIQLGGASRFKVIVSGSTVGGGLLTQAVVDTDLLTTAGFSLNRTTTLTAGLADAFIFNFSGTTINGLFTVTRQNYIELDTPTGTATITNACVFNFDAAAGTHKCVDAGTTKTTPTGVNAWMVTNVNSTLYYAPIYNSKTS